MSEPASIVFVFMAAALTGIGHSTISLFMNYAKPSDRDKIKYSCCFAGWYTFVGGILGIAFLRIYAILASQELQFGLSTNMLGIFVVSIFSGFAYLSTTYGLSKLPPTLAIVLALFEAVFVVLMAAFFGRPIPDFFTMVLTFVLLTLSLVSIAVGVTESPGNSSKPLNPSIMKRVTAFLRRLRADKDKLRGVFSIMIGSVFFAAQIVISDDVLKTVPPLTLSVLMLAIGGSFLLAVSAWWQKSIFYDSYKEKKANNEKSHKSSTFPLRNSLILMVLIVILLGLRSVGDWWFYYLTQSNSGSAFTATCYTTNVLFVAFFQWIIFTKLLKSRIKQYIYKPKYIILAGTLAIIAVGVLNYSPF